MNTKIKILCFVLFAATAPSIATAQSSWAGLYAGPEISQRKMDADWTTTVAYNPGGAVIPFVTSPDESYSDSTAELGGYVGYNWDINPSWITGVEFNVGLGSNEDEVNRIPGLITGLTNYTTVEAGTNASILGRAGYLINPTMMVYAAAGIGFQELDVEASCVADTNVCNPALGTQSNSESSTESGFILGVGFEMQLWSNWIGRAEYSYADYGEFDFTALPPIAGASFGADATIDVTMKTFSVGMAYKF